MILYDALDNRAGVAETPATLVVPTAALNGEYSLSRNAQKNTFELFHFANSFRAVRTPNAVFRGLERILTFNLALAQVIHIARAFGHNIRVSVHFVLSFLFLLYSFSRFIVIWDSLLTFSIIADYGRKSRTFLKNSAQKGGVVFVHFADPEKCGRLALTFSHFEFSKRTFAIKLSYLTNQNNAIIFPKIDNAPSTIAISKINPLYKSRLLFAFLFI